MERIQGSLRVASVSNSGSPKGYVPLGIYRVEETKGLIDGMGIVGLHGVDGHNGSIEGHVVYSMPCNSPLEVTWSDLRESRDSMGTDCTHRATHSVGRPSP